MSKVEIKDEAVVAVVKEKREMVPFVGLLASQGVSLLGNNFTAVAVPWFVLTLTGSAAQMGLVGFMSTLPLILGAFFGGPIIDRLGQKRASILSDVASALPVAAIPLLFVWGMLPLWMLLILVFMAGLLDTSGVTAREALLPTVARKAGVSLERASGIGETLQGSMALVGPVLAGLLIVAVGAVNALWVNVLTFGVSALLMVVTQRRAVRVMRVGEVRSSYWEDTLAGLRFVWNEKVIRALVLLFAVIVFLMIPVIVIIPVHLLSIGRSALDVGIFEAMFGGGAVLGALMYVFVGTRVAARRLLIGSLFGVGGAFVGLALLPPFGVLLVAGLGVGVAGGVVSPLSNTLLQQRIPDEMRGRVLGVVNGVALVASPIGFLLAGVLTEFVGGQVVLGVIAFLLLGVAVWSLFVRAFRNL